MRFTPLDLPGVHLIEPEPVVDERGLFMRTFCQREMAAHGLETAFVQCNVSVSERKGTLRGLHYQAAPHGETKLLRCARGALYAVVLDLRPGSPAQGRGCAVTLRAADPRALAGRFAPSSAPPSEVRVPPSADPRGAMLYVPEGCANGFQTLEDDTEVHYQMSAFHHPESARGVRWDDPQLAIAWPPAEPRILSARDAALPPFNGERPGPPSPGRDLP
jgi:dTDP-4-dehydrorhamnose 3,5-epimerase